MTGCRSVRAGIVLVCGVAAMTFIGGRFTGTSCMRTGGVATRSAAVAVPATRVACRYGVKATADSVTGRQGYDDAALAGMTVNAVSPSAPDQARFVRDATKDLLQFTKEQVSTINVVQADDMRSRLREAQGYILSTRRLLDGEPL